MDPPSQVVPWCQDYFWLEIIIIDYLRLETSKVEKILEIIKVEKSKWQ